MTDSSRRFEHTTTTLRFLVSGLLVVGFLALFVLMLHRTGDKDEVRWSRLVYLFGSAEAIVFVAIGWIFGGEVHRARAENAEGRAATNEHKAANAEEQLGKSREAMISAKERGHALASLIRAEAQAESFQDEDLLAGGDPGIPKPNRSTLRRLSAVANELFPEDGSVAG